MIFSFKREIFTQEKITLELHVVLGSFLFKRGDSHSSENNTRIGPMLGLILTQRENFRSSDEILAQAKKMKLNLLFFIV